jgi:putative ABC transport system permease protein
MAMNLWVLSWKNIIYKPGAFVLSLLLFALGIGLVSFLLLLDHQVQDKFEKNLAGIDLVVGAKGSPLQLILSNMYFIDAPTGNITLEEAKPFLNPKNPLIAEAIPLSLGDSYKGYRIVGTQKGFLELYQAEMEEGQWIENDFDVVIGTKVAQKLGLVIGDEFKSTHGFTDDEDLAHDHEDNFIVRGVLKPTGAVIDQLILCNNQTYWHIHGAHDHEGHDHEGHDHEGHDHEGHDHEGHDHDDHNHDDHDHKDSGKDVSALNVLELERDRLLNSSDEQEITSLLLKFKGRSFQSLNLARNINENTDMQAASPAIEVNRLFSLMDTGSQMLKVLAYAIIFVSALSVFIALFSRMDERKYELAIMRTKGAARGQLFGLILMEGSWIALLGSIVGLLFSHFGVYLLATSAEANYRYTLDPMVFLSGEFYLLIGGLIVALLASLIPAIIASWTDIAKTLTA